MIKDGVYWQNKSSILCLIGGIIIGIVCSSRMAVFGRVTGISGIISTSTKLNFSDRKFLLAVPDFGRITRFMFVGGLIVS
jgi:hypothetical protein